MNMLISITLYENMVNLCISIHKTHSKKVCASVCIGTRYQCTLYKNY